jgi:hypothetical protein
MFFPLMKVEGLEGWLDLVYHGPNNWENRDKSKKYLHLIWSDGNRWKSSFMSEITFGERLTLSTNDLTPEQIENNLAVVYASNSMLPSELEILPIEKTWVGDVPAWRASAGFRNSTAQVSYQAEVEPLPDKASLMTFHPFIQFGDVENYLVVVNLRNNPVVESAEIEVRNSYTGQDLGKASIKSNSVTKIPLDDYGFQPTDLPIFICKTMAGIPFGLGVNKAGTMLSLEHTHPPASLVLFGDRRKVQSHIKNAWMQSLGAGK